MSREAGRPSTRPQARARRRRRRGTWAERWVAWRYRLAGWRVLAHNVRIGHDEVDLVVTRGRRVRFVEVRFLGRGRPIAAGQAASPAKRRRVLRAATRLLQRHPAWHKPQVEAELAVVSLSRIGWPRVWRSPIDEGA